MWTKFTLAYLWDVIPYPTVSPCFLAFHSKRIAEFAAGNPIDWYKDCSCVLRLALDGLQEFKNVLDPLLV